MDGGRSFCQWKRPGQAVTAAGRIKLSAVIMANVPVESQLTVICASCGSVGD